MLQRLYIQNYALIRKLDLDLQEGFSAITGETGSGKSILIGALGLALGERADTHVLFEKDVKCVVEAEFDLSTLGLEEFFAVNDLEYQLQSTLRREISPSGRSRAFVNDSPVQLGTMRKLASMLVDLHSQHQTLLLHEEDFQLSLLDIFASHSKELEQYRKTYSDFRAKHEAIRKCQAYIRDHRIDKDYLQFQLNELDEVSLVAGEGERIKDELGLMEHVEDIKSVLHASTAQLSDDGGILDQINDLAHRIDGISDHTKGLDELSKRMESVRLELDDIQGTIEDLADTVELDPERQLILNEQMDAFQKLFSKHRVSDVEGLITLRAEIDEQLIRADTAHHELEALTMDLVRLKKELSAQAGILTKSREKASVKFKKVVSSSFNSLSLLNARIDIEISQSSDFHENGMDDINILFNANKGGELELLHKVASGGELSRLMLILKSELAKARHLPTLIFDEIDTGVSGEIAAQMASKLREMAEGRQVISITHLPQVAARAHQHLQISKSDTKERSITHVRLLDDEERLQELAKMLSGARVSQASVENARELLRN